MTKKVTVTWFLLALVASFPLHAAPSDDKPKKVPDFPSSGIWLNSEPLTRDVLKDKVTLLYFFDYTSVNCLREISILKEWIEKYHPYGLETIWIHAPEFQFAHQRENVEEAAGRLQISYPVFLDNDFKLWEALGNRSWPTKHLVDGKGLVLYSQVGEGGYLPLEVMIRDALRAANPSAILPAPLFEKEPERYSLTKCGPMISETYIGYKRAGWWGGEIANRRLAPPDEPTTFRDRGERVERGFFVEGLWTNREDHFEHARKTNEPFDYLGLIYLAHEVYAVLSRTSGAPVSRVYVTRDEEPVPPERRGVDLREDPDGQTYFLLQDPRLYYLITAEDELQHEVKLWPVDEGVAVNSFSFSNRCLSDFEHL